MPEYENFSKLKARLIDELGPLRLLELVDEVSTTDDLAELVMQLYTEKEVLEALED